MQLKTGHLSFYNFSNYLGASFFSDTYYIQFDFFSIISILLSFFMNFEMAFGITELLKLFLGTLLFGYFLYRLMDKIFGDLSDTIKGTFIVIGLLTGIVILAILVI